MKSFGKLLLQLFLFIAFAGIAEAQSPDQQLIVRWERGDAAVKTSLHPAVQRRWLAKPLHIELLTYPDPASCALAQKKLASHRGVRALEFNQVVSFRADPNDASFNEQRDNFDRAGYRDAWDLTAGGSTIENQDIVIAILDAGFDITHEDIQPNLWINPHDVPNDGVDNDNNGYVDDRHGWDMTGDDPNLPSDNHGTQVIGLLGAKGNNGIGVTGTNWDTKMMLFTIRTTAHIIEAYEYIREQRRRYNESNGAEGALVVATNASFGIEGGTCINYAVWGGLYDELGQVGILTAASTANRSWDVDDFGDMPTDCPSDYLIGVANLGENDALWRSSGFGRESVDLGAPGEMSFSTIPADRYGSFGSTSAAAPYVTGAIALMYATPCPALLDKMKTDPAGAALLVRDVILGSTRESSSLQFRTSTGGVIDVAEAQRALSLICDGTDLQDFTISSVSPNPAADFAVLETNAIVFSSGARVDLFDVMGRHVSSRIAERIGFNPIKVRVDLVGIPAGVYVVRLSERDRVAEAKLVVR
ncbi:S8 family peptidase [Neolewinella persica]|uniref:S8 family peptidase n=1 Tax=Neolewinella persica TaxID=70998 RepID=UPI000381410F|nr:S8 family peptidase [Neolewinella persica]